MSISLLNWWVQEINLQKVCRCWIAGRNLTLKVLNFWKFTSYCSLKPLWSGMGEVVPARTSPTLHPPSPPTVHQLSWISLSELILFKWLLSMIYRSVIVAHTWNGLTVIMRIIMFLVVIDTNQIQPSILGSSRNLYKKLWVWSTKTKRMNYRRRTQGGG